jgi:SAM-dependent methyltransferase
MQRVAGTTGLIGFGMVELIELAREVDRDPRTCVWLELGIGWHPVLPLVLALLDAPRIVALDRNPWLDWRYAREALDRLGEDLPTLSRRLDAPVTELATRYECLRAARTLEDLFRAARMEYLCPVDAADTGLPDASVDVVCSSNVLEHVSRGALEAIHAEAWRVLRPGGLAIHRIDPSDHFAHGDPRITRANFLRYSPGSWYWYGGSGLAYHSRLRAIEHREIFERYFEVLVDREHVDTPALAALRAGKLAVHATFSRFVPEALAADYLRVVGRRRQQGCRPGGLHRADDA